MDPRERDQMIEKLRPGVRQTLEAALIAGDRPAAVAVDQDQRLAVVEELHRRLLEAGQLGRPSGVLAPAPHAVLHVAPDKDEQREIKKAAQAKQRLAQKLAGEVIPVAAPAKAADGSRTLDELEAAGEATDEWPAGEEGTDEQEGPTTMTDPKTDGDVAAAPLPDDRSPEAWQQWLTASAKNLATLSAARLAEVLGLVKQALKARRKADRQAPKRDAKKAAIKAQLQALKQQLADLEAPLELSLTPGTEPKKAKLGRNDAAAATGGYRCGTCGKELNCAKGLARHRTVMHPAA